MRLRRDGLSLRELDGETILLDLNTSKYLRLNRAGTVLLPGLADGEDRHALVARLRERFDVDEERARADVDSFLESMRRVGLTEDA